MVSFHLHITAHLHFEKKTNETNNDNNKNKNINNSNDKRKVPFRLYIYPEIKNMTVEYTPPRKIKTMREKKNG